VHVCLTKVGVHKTLLPGYSELHLCDGAGQVISDTAGYAAFVVDPDSAAITPCPSDETRFACPALGQGADPTFRMQTVHAGYTTGKYEEDETVQIADTYAQISAPPDKPLSGYSIIVTLMDVNQGCDVSCPYNVWSGINNGDRPANMAKWVAWPSNGTFNSYTGTTPELLEAIEDTYARSTAVKDEVWDAPVGSEGYNSSPTAVFGRAQDDATLDTGEPRVYIVTSPGGTPADYVWETATTAIGRAPEYAFLFSGGTYDRVGMGTLTSAQLQARPVPDGYAFHSAKIPADNLFRCNDRHGAPYDAHPCNGDPSYPYLTQLDAVAGYIFGYTIQ
ncbi:hypothetical protein CJV21_24590, partial [Salmonella enterica subsp. enterica serovar Rubislaw]|nr:hypothetical protein [Salmonella enterica subsp. enterica serovar Rubislaw]